MTNTSSNSRNTMGNILTRAFDKTGKTPISILYTVAGRDLPVILIQQGGKVMLSVDNDAHQIAVMKDSDWYVVDRDIFEANFSNMIQSKTISGRFITGLYSFTKSAGFYPVEGLDKLSKTYGVLKDLETLDAKTMAGELVALFNGVNTALDGLSDVINDEAINKTIREKALKKAGLLQGAIQSVKE